MKYTPREIRIALDESILSEIVPEHVLLLVMGLYGDKDRHYHTFDHAIEVVSWVNRALEETFDLSLLPYTGMEIRLAALFHDVIYTSAGSPTNEEQSCKLFRQHMTDHRGKVPLESVERTCELIMLTAQHGKLESDDVPRAGQLLLDADIANMGTCNWEVFAANNENVVEELKLKYTAQEISIGRKAFLAGMLAKKSIYLSEWFRERLEDQARRNLMRILHHA